MKTCPNCGYAIFDTSLQACPRCGYALAPEVPATYNPHIQPPITPAGLPSLEAVSSQPQSLIASSQTTPSWPVPAAQSQPKKRSTFLLWSLVALAVLLVVTGGGITYISGHGGLFGKAPLIAQTTATATSLPTATATATALPTATPKPTATATPVPRLVTIFKDPLTASSHNAGWYTDGGSVYFQTDGYHIKNSYECYAPIGSQTDFNVSVQVKQSNTTSADGSGITFREIANTLKEYVFEITPDGSFTVYNRVGDYLVMPAHSSAIHQGSNVTNAIEVDARGSHYDFFINGVHVASANDSMRLSGQIGLMTEKIGDEAVFTNITIAAWV